LVTRQYLDSSVQKYCLMSVFFGQWRI